MPYSIDRYSSNLFDPGSAFPLNIADNTINSTATSIRIIGRGITNYGEIVAESLVHIMENFAGQTAPANPITGQLWWQQDPTNPSAPQKLSIWNGSVWKSVTGATPSPTGPTGPAVGDTWYNTTNQQFNFWDGDTWNIVYDGSAALPTNPGPSAPANPLEGTLWYNTTLDILYVYNGSVWEALQKQSANTSVSYDTINGSDVIIIKVNGNILAIWSSAVITYGTLWNGVTPSGKPNLQALYPVGLRVGLNYSNFAGNGISSNGSVHYGTWALAAGATLEATYADIAERYASDEELTPGTLVAIAGTSEVTKTRTVGDTNVFGVVSTAPAFKMNSEAGDDTTHPYIALSGRVPVFVKGKVSKGDRLIASDEPGIARVLDKTLFTDPFDAVMAVFGRAIADKTTDELGTVEVTVGAK